MDSYGSLDFLETCAPDVRAMYEYWRSKRAGDALPAPQAIDPIDIPKLLPEITLVNVARDPLTFTYRLVGTRECAVRGFDPTGWDIRNGFIGDSADAVFARYKEVSETGQVGFFSEKNKTEGNRWMPFETIYLPLAEDGRTVTRILVFSHLVRDLDAE